MTLGQSMLATAALVVITILALSAYRISVQSMEDELKGEAVKIASDAASSLLNEALKKSFDLSAPTDYYANPSEFTAPSSLGPNTYESNYVQLPDKDPFRSISTTPNYGYNDFDDYNGYVRVVNTSTMTGFTLRCVVTYVQPYNFNIVSSTQTYCKRLTVYVTNPKYLKDDTLLFSTVMSY
jgi:hypothetical protein